MTEAEWQLCNDPDPMIRSLVTTRYQRELRLFAVACVRRVWFLLPDATREAVEISERYADGRISEEELRRAVAAADEVAQTAFPGHSAPDARAYATSAAVDACSVWPQTASKVQAAISCAASAAACAAAESVPDDRYDAVYEATRQAELVVQCELLREIIGRRIE